MVERVIATLRHSRIDRESLAAEHGPDLMFHQSGGCCDNSAANCYPSTDLTIGPNDGQPGDDLWRPLHQRVATRILEAHLAHHRRRRWQRRHLLARGSTGKRPSTPACACTTMPEMAAVEVEDRALGR